MYLGCGARDAWSESSRPRRTSSWRQPPPAPPSRQRAGSSLGARSDAGWKSRSLRDDVENLLQEDQARLAHCPELVFIKLQRKEKKREHPAHKKKRQRKRVPSLRPAALRKSCAPASSHELAGALDARLDRRDKGRDRVALVEEPAKCVATEDRAAHWTRVHPSEPRKHF